MYHSSQSLDSSQSSVQENSDQNKSASENAITNLIITISDKKTFTAGSLLKKIDKHCTELSDVLTAAIESGLPTIAGKVINLPGALNGLFPALEFLQSPKGKQIQWEQDPKKTNAEIFKELYEKLINEISKRDFGLDPQKDKEKIQQIQTTIQYMIINKEDNSIEELLKNDGITNLLDINALLMIALENSRSKVAILFIQKGAKNLPTALTYLQKPEVFSKSWDVKNGYEATRGAVIEALCKLNGVNYEGFKIDELENNLKFLIQVECLKYKYYSSYVVTYYPYEKARAEVSRLLDNAVFYQKINLDALLLTALNAKQGAIMIKLIEQGAKNLITILSKLQSMRLFIDQYIYNTWETSNYPTVVQSVSKAIILNASNIFSNNDEKEPLFSVITYLVENNHENSVNFLNVEIIRKQLTEKQLSELLLKAIFVGNGSAATLLVQIGAKERLIYALTEAQKINQWHSGSYNQLVTELVTQILNNDKLENNEENNRNPQEINDRHHLLQAATLGLIKSKDKDNLLRIIQTKFLINHLIWKTLFSETLADLDVELATVLLETPPEKITTLVDFVCQLLNTPFDQTSEEKRLAVCKVIVLKIEELLLKPKEKSQTSLDEETKLKLCKTLLTISKNISNEYQKRKKVVTDNTTLLNEIGIDLMILALNTHDDILSEYMVASFCAHSNLAFIILAIHKVQVDCIFENLTSNGQKHYMNLINIIKNDNIFKNLHNLSSKTQSELKKIMEFIVFQENLNPNDFLSLEHLKNILDYNNLLHSAIRLKKNTIAEKVLLKSIVANNSKTSKIEEFLFQALQLSLEVDRSLTPTFKDDSKEDNQDFLKSSIQLRLAIVKLMQDLNAFCIPILNCLDTCKETLKNMVTLKDTEAVTMILDQIYGYALINRIEFTDTENQFLITLLEKALEAENITIAKYLENKTVKLPSNRLQEFLEYAVEKNKFVLCNHLIEIDKENSLDLTKKINLNGTSYSLPIYALQSEYIEIATSLLFAIKDTEKEIYETAFNIESDRRKGSFLPAFLAGNPKTPQKLPEDCYKLLNQKHGSSKNA